ncbi:MAG: ROK family protein [Kiritimatiellae bacterium]|nr:ROK family protein [Kiritimatiellia bacterium]
MTDLLAQLEQDAAPRHAIQLDPGFRPAALWTRAYRKLAAAAPRRRPVLLALSRPDGIVFHHRLEVLPWDNQTAPATTRYIERTLKYLLWQRGGSTVSLAGCPEAAAALARVYAPGGARDFDAQVMGERVFGAPFSVRACQESELPAAREPQMKVGGFWKGCRVGFDLGGSDRKCAAVLDGQVVHSEEVPWSPTVATDWHYQRDGIEDSINRAAAHLPRVDCIGGSSAGVIVNNEVRIASLFRAIPPEDFDRHVRRIFIEIGKKWKVPTVVMNDGDVTALAGSLALDDRPVLGMAFGTSLAGGYCSPEGGLKPWLNELAFVPIDFRREGAPKDDWSGDHGVGAQYLSQQAVGRLAAAAGVDFPPTCTGLPERLAEMQRRLAAGDRTARDIFVAVGRFLGYAVAYADDFYQLKRFLALGRVTSGAAGDIIVKEATDVLTREFPDVAAKVKLEVPDEKQKRHGQAMVAASLPEDQIS